MARKIKVKVLRSFVHPQHGVFVEGQTAEIPTGTDYIKAGLCERIPAKKRTPKRKRSTGDGAGDDS